MKIKNKTLLGVLTGLGLSALSSSAALITFTDDGTDTTIAWSGAFDGTGLGVVFNDLPTLSFSSDGIYVNSGDILLGSDLALVLSVYMGFSVVESSGWSDPSGDLFSPVTVGLGAAEFYFNAGSGFGGFVSSGDGSVELAGTLSDNGFTANESVTFNNPNVSGDSGQIVLQTFIATVPEPSSATLLGLGAIGLLTRRTRHA